MGDRNWKEIALYLATCHAATASQDCALKSVSRYRKMRLVSICVKAKAFIEGDDAPYHSMDERRVLNLLASAILAEPAP